MSSSNVGSRIFSFVNHCGCSCASSTRNFFILKNRRRKLPSVEGDGGVVVVVVVIVVAVVVLLTTQHALISPVPVHDDTTPTAAFPASRHSSHLPHSPSCQAYHDNTLGMKLAPRLLGPETPQRWRMWSVGAGEPSIITPRGRHQIPA
ncbi:hypothetical protein E2C01_000076 [Portunus trituberculatus]|uniref:Uncharacterized protein n=1 Tax=Portunus trituberculatus TaxID=210409 RepID=A0A5B7CIP0_PORTR|nr:hypothetical protein [Portunus trituberculatus]